MHFTDSIRLLISGEKPVVPALKPVSFRSQAWDSWHVAACNQRTSGFRWIDAAAGRICASAR
jgi:hypothetical protein